MESRVLGDVQDALGLFTGLVLVLLFVHVSGEETGCSTFLFLTLSVLLLLLCRFCCCFIQGKKKSSGGANPGLAAASKAAKEAAEKEAKKKKKRDKKNFNQVRFVRSWGDRHE